jgi:hypothetical protein
MTVSLEIINKECILAVSPRIIIANCQVVWIHGKFFFDYLPELICVATELYENLKNIISINVFNDSFNIKEL